MTINKMPNLLTAMEIYLSAGGKMKTVETIRDLLNGERPVDIAKKRGTTRQAVSGIKRDYGL